MVYGIYQSAGGMQVNQYAMDVLANNLANASTTGFKQDLALLRERKVETREQITDASLRNEILDEMTGGSLVAQTFTAFEQGSIEVTDSPLDVAIEGDGFFAVLDGDNVRYTRDGRFTMNRDGELVTAAGNHKVLDNTGKTISVGSEAVGQASIEGDGSVRVGDTVIATIDIVDFEDKTRLRKVGANMLQPMGVEPRDTNAVLRVRSLEHSTVDPTMSMVKMMQAMRIYELNSRMVGLADSTLGRAVNDIARIR